MQPAVSRLAADPGAVFAAARVRFEAMLDEIPYVDRPEHSMATSMFSCAAMLAVFQVLRTQQIDAHAWGQAIQGLPVVLTTGGPAGEEGTAADAVASQQSPAANEFVFEMVEPDPAAGTTARGMNITSCAICHLFGRHDALELVPYMCAFDDVVSDANGQGLRRTGTIALGASRCDFRFTEGAPLRLAAQYPDQIRQG
jgi:hypothetical protein